MSFQESDDQRRQWRKVTFPASECSYGLLLPCPHYGWRCGCAPARGTVQWLRGRPPLV